MKKLFYIFVLTITIIACSPVSWMQIGNGEVMKNEFEKNSGNSCCNCNDSFIIWNSGIWNMVI